MKARNKKSLRSPSQKHGVAIQQFRDPAASGLMHEHELRRRHVFRNDVPHSGGDDPHVRLPRKGTPERMAIIVEAKRLRDQGLSLLKVATELGFEQSTIRLLLLEWKQLNLS